MASLNEKLIKIDPGSEAVILLHGLNRTSRSLNKAGRILAEYGYRIIKPDYPSRQYDIRFLALNYIDPALRECEKAGIKKIHFLTHSLGGILIRYYLSIRSIDNLGKVVMLAPPNRGSEIVDKIGSWKIYKFINGRAGLQLGTDSKSVPNNLGLINFSAGIIAGNKTVNFLLSLMIPGPNDGKVSVNRAKVEGMADFIVVPHTHPFIMQRRDVIHHALYFIQNGCFAK